MANAVDDQVFTWFMYNIFYGWLRSTFWWIRCCNFLLICSKNMTSLLFKFLQASCKSGFQFMSVLKSVHRWKLNMKVVVHRRTWYIESGPHICCPKIVPKMHESWWRFRFLHFGPKKRKRLCRYRLLSRKKLIKISKIHY